MPTGQPKLLCLDFYCGKDFAAPSKILLIRLRMYVKGEYLHMHNLMFLSKTAVGEV